MRAIPPIPSRPIAEPAVADPRRARRRLLIRLGGTALALAVLFAIIPFGDVVAALGRVPGPVWMAAVAVYLTLHLIGVLKWMLLINTAGAGLRFVDAVRCYYLGLFGNIFLPSIVGGDVVRAGLAMKLSRSKSGLVLGSVVDRFLDTVGLAGVAGIGALLLPTALDDRSRTIFLMIAAGLIALGVIALVAVLLLRGTRLSFKRRRVLAKVRQSLMAFRDHPGRVVSSLVLGMVLQALLVFLNAWLGNVIGIHVSPVVWLFAWPLAKIAAILPVTQGGIGVREGALVILLQPFRIAAPAAMATGLVFTAVVMSGGLIGGAIAMLLGRFSGPRPRQ